MTTAPFSLDAAREALLGPQSDGIIDFIFRLNTGQKTDDVPVETVRTVDELGWVEGTSRSFTPDGYLVADSIREYVFFVRRDRRLHCEGKCAYLSAAYYAGKSVLEVGSGFGCNLIPISKTARRVVGIEPVSIYRDMSRILCEREGLPPIDVRGGSGENIPVRDDVFDVVLCVSAHQYMDIRAAIREMTRLLASGGELQIVGGTLGVYARERGLALLSKGLREVVPYSITIANTLSYMATGKRAYTRSHSSSTAFPIYPTRSRMARWLNNEGLVQMRPHDRIGSETTFCFSRRPA